MENKHKVLIKNYVLDFPINLDSLAHAALPVNCSATIWPHNL